MKKHSKKLREEDGFTLIEMLIVLMVVSLLILMVVANVGGVEESVSKTTNKGIAQTVESEMLIHEMDTGEKLTAVELHRENKISEAQLKAYKAAEAEKNKDSK